MTISSECSFDESHQPQETPTLGSSEVICDIPFGGMGSNPCHPGSLVVFLLYSTSPPTLFKATAVYFSQLCGLPWGSSASHDNQSEGPKWVHSHGWPRALATRWALIGVHRLNGSVLLHVGPSRGCGTSSRHEGSGRPDF